jgi:hypothetical protein
MILFREEHVEPILRGRKTQTRRNGEFRWLTGSVHKCYTKPPYTRGGAEPFAKVRILNVRQQRLKEMTLADVKAEGYGCPEDYVAVFKDIYGEWNGNMLVWVVDFELVR